MLEVKKKIKHCKSNECLPLVFNHFFRKVIFWMLDIEKVTNIALWSKGCHLKKKKLSRNVQLWKLISQPIFIQYMIFFLVEALLTPQNWKQKNKVTNVNLSACNTKQTWRGCCSRTKRVSKQDQVNNADSAIIFLINH